MIIGDKDLINLEEDFLENSLSMQRIAEDSCSYSCSGCSCKEGDEEDEGDCEEEI